MLLYKYPLPVGRFLPYSTEQNPKAKIESRVQLPPKQTAVEIEEARDTAMKLPAIRRKLVTSSYQRRSDLILVRNEFLSQIRKGVSISVDSPSGVEEIHKHLFAGRAGNHYGLPVALYHGALATLQYRLETLDSQVKDARIQGSGSGEPEDNVTKLDSVLFEAAQNYFKTSRAFVKKEGTRWPLVRPFFISILGSNDLREEHKTSEAGLERGSRGAGRPAKGENRADAVWGFWSALELKNEPGLAGDASLQGVLWYMKSCDSLKACTHIPLSTFWTLIPSVNRKISSSLSYPSLFSVSWATCSRFQ